MKRGGEVAPRPKFKPVNPYGSLADTSQRLVGERPESTKPADISFEDAGLGDQYASVSNPNTGIVKNAKKKEGETAAYKLTEEGLGALTKRSAGRKSRKTRKTKKVMRKRK